MKNLLSFQYARKLNLAISVVLIITAITAFVYALIKRAEIFIAASFFAAYLGSNAYTLNKIAGIIEKELAANKKMNNVENT